MTIAVKDPPAGGADGSIGLSCLAADFQPNIPNEAPAQAEISRDPRAVREAKRLLSLEFLHECAGGIAVHAALVQTFAEIGDTAGTLYSLKRLFAHAKAAHAVYVDLRQEAGQ
jgi:hypothetical protein